MFDKHLMPFMYNIDTTVVWVAVTVGLLLYIIGYFAGGRLTKGRILVCTVMVTVIGVLALKVPMIAFSKLMEQYELNPAVFYEQAKEAQQAEANQPQPAEASQPSKEPATTTEKKTLQDLKNIDLKEMEPQISFQVISLLIYTAWIAILIGMGIFFYETLIVTAEEIEKKG